jgi:pSer/pThr/pTyr-binding forkhead associated (FHA) protein
MALSLIVLNPGKSQGKTILVLRFPFLIGRDPACQLRPGSTLVSNRHCALLLREGKICIEDLGSTNGTRVDGQRIFKPLQLVGGERIDIGPLKFMVKLEQYVAVDEPTPLPPVGRGHEATDDEAASILLYLSQEEKPPKGGLVFDSDDIPEGSTALDLNADAPKESANATKSEAGSSAKEPSKGDTASAADAILMQYRRRPRK